MKLHDDNNEKEEKTKFSVHSIKMAWKVFGFMVAFIAMLLALLWTFQTVFLQNFYTAIKTGSIRSSASAIAQNIDNQDLQTLIERISLSDSICIKIVNEEGEDICSVETMRNCKIHKAPADVVQGWFQDTIKNGGSLEYFGKDYNKEFTAEMKFSGKLPPSDHFVQESLIYSKIVTKADGENVMILLNTFITPVNATVDTLRIQLVYISIIMLVIALAIAIVMSRHLSKPIIQINMSAKELAKGNYDIVFKASGYQEISELNQTLNYTAKELSKVETLRRELIGNISHDLRTPLTMIAGYAEVMRDIPGENTPENVQIIIDEANHLSTLVSDLLDISKLQSGVQTVNLSVFSLTQNIHNILMRYAKLVEQNGVKINLEADSDVFVSADDVKIAQVIYNLVNNAINYTGRDKTVTIKQIIVADNSQRYARIEIKDSGEGISPQQLVLIWDRYYKVDKMHKQAMVGTGLGLSIVKSVLELHHAKYGVESEEGVGSTFWFELPIVENLK